MRYSRRRISLCCLFSLTFLSDRPLGFIASSYPQRNSKVLLQHVASLTEEALSSTRAKDNQHKTLQLRSIIFSNLRNDQEPELLRNFLMELGASDSSISNAHPGTIHPGRKQKHYKGVKRTTASSNLPSSTETDFTTHKVWDAYQVSARFPASTDLMAIRDQVHDRFPCILPSCCTTTTTTSTAETQNGLRHVQTNRKPVIVPPFVIRFPLRGDETIQRLLKDEVLVGSKNSVKEIKLQGGRAFGTGSHATTKLGLQWIAKRIQPNMTLMDFGAGSGILGISACKLHPTVTAVGVDIDATAVQIANANAAMNGVTMRNFLLSPKVAYMTTKTPINEVPAATTAATTNNERKRHIVLASSKVYTRSQPYLPARSTEAKQRIVIAKSKVYAGKPKLTEEVLPELWNRPIYDACVANLLTESLLTLATTFARLVKPGGLLALTGIRRNEVPMILEAYEGEFEEIMVELELNEWVLITGKRRQT